MGSSCKVTLMRPKSNVNGVAGLAGAGVVCLSSVSGSVGPIVADIQLVLSWDNLTILYFNAG